MADANVDLVTFAEFCAWVGIQAQNKNVNQDQVEQLITAASMNFSKAAGGRAFLSASDVQEFRGYGHTVQQVRYPPVASGLVIAWYNWDSWETATEAQYPREIDLTRGIVRMTNSGFGRGSRWRFSYTGGYAQASVPADIKQAVCELVQRARMRADGKQGIKSEGRGDQNTSYDLAVQMPEPIRAVAQSYRVIYSQ